MTWPSVSLGSVAILERDGEAPSALSPDTRYVGLEHVDGEGAIATTATVGTAELKSTKFRFSEDHILYGKLRPYLRKIARPGFVGVCSTDIIPIRPTSAIDRGYLFHFLRLPKMVALATSRCTGANLPRLSPSQLETFEVPLPPLPEQKWIAAILDAADALRAKRRESIEQLDSLVQATFLEMFGDPVTNPKGWPHVELATLISQDDRINYGVVQPGDDFPGGRPLVRVGDFADGVLDTANLKTIAPDIESRYVRSRLKGDELLVSCVGSIGTICKVTANERGFNIARAVARVPLMARVNREFVMHCLRSSAVQRHFAKETRTVSQPTLNIALIKTAPILTPPVDLQTRFAFIVESIEQQKARLKTHLTELDTLFASLQSRAFNGELVA
jgi:type I restriction enzyme S subunit